MSSTAAPPAKRRRLNFSASENVTVLVIRLPDIEPEMFEPYVQWSYSGQIVLVDTVEEEHNPEYREKQGQFYVVADVLDDTLLRNTIMDSIIANIKATRCGPCYDEIQVAYEKTVVGSKLRRLMLEWHAFELTSTEAERDNAVWWEEYVAMMHHEFLADLVVQTAKQAAHSVERIEPEKADCCRYHDHDDAVPACTATEKL